MDPRSLSKDQLKEIKKQLNKRNRKFFFFQHVENPHNAEGVSVAHIDDELARRKIAKLKFKG